MELKKPMPCFDLERLAMEKITPLGRFMGAKAGVVVWAILLRQGVRVSVIKGK